MDDSEQPLENHTPHVEEPLWHDDPSDAAVTFIAEEESNERPATVGSARDDIQIPDFTLIKRIGSGAYGEVWLAQGITGALRAIKIVWREDFELTKTFHREFLGIQQFEPISRGHPGLVHILHVGWNEANGFYYCVMELGDDVEVGPHIEDTSTYIPRTLGSDLKRHGRLDLHFCQEAGAFIADALHYMHVRGLTHRDIKPSNIIYCGGVCKLADIGLVAMSGERSFVGTEGFVPPEGPGTPQADIYSLGKVLYEMSSGKDRMEFPEVPDEIDPSEWPFWNNFNRVILRACAPDLNERWATGEAFADALRAVTDARPVSLTQRVTKLLRRVALFGIGSCLIGGGWTSYKHQKEWAYTLPAPVKPAPPLPEQPTPGKPWKSMSGPWFSYQKDRHVADAPVDFTWFNTFLEETMRPFEGEVVTMPIAGNKTISAVVVSKPDADDFCEWITAQERAGGSNFPDQFEYTWHAVKPPRPPGAMPLRKGWSAIVCEITRFGFGRVVITSTPAPAEVFQGDELLGRTPLTLPRVREGNYEFNIRYPGYKTEVVNGTIKKGQSRNHPLKLKNISAVVWGKPWENTLKMKFIPLGQAMLGVYEVRRRDYLEYARARKLPPIPEQELEKATELDNPITHVTREDAQNFCQWLTDKEQATEIIEGNQHYRLPSDNEWSMAGNVPREIGSSPAERHLHVDGIYPWGFTLLPPESVANLFDKTAAAAEKGAKGIENYDDHQAKIAAVGTMKPDWLGRYDLSGNVWEWVADDYGGSDASTATQGTARGGSWLTKERQETLTSFRKPVPINARQQDVGFRVMLSDGRPAREDE